MPHPEFDAETHLDALAATVGLPIAPEHRPGVAANLARAAQLARLVMDFPLPDEAEAGPVFRP